MKPTNCEFPRYVIFYVIFLVRYFIQGVQSSRKHDSSIERTERFPVTAVPFPASAAVPFPAIESAVVSLIPHISLYMRTFIRIL
jgi:hypothetical protein